MKRLLRRLLLGLFVLAVLVMLGGWLWLRTLDAEDYRADIIAAIEEATGRDFAIAGPLSIGRGLAPGLVAEDVALADAPWGEAAPMVEAQRVEVAIRILPLLFGETVVDRIEVAGARMVLKRNAEGAANWQFGDGEGGKVPSELPAIGRLRLTDTAIIYENAATGAALEIGVTDLDLATASLSESLDFAFDGTYAGMPLTVIGEVGPIAALLDGGALDLDLDLSSADARLRVEGRIADPGAFAGLDLTLDGRGEDLARINRFHDLDLPHTVSYEGTARLRDTDGVYRFEDIDADARLGDLSLSGAGEVADIETFRIFSLRVSLQGGDLAALGEAIGTTLPRTETVEAQARFYRAQGRYGVEGLSGNASRPGATMTASGDVADLEGFAGLDLEFSARGGDLAGLGDVFGETLPETRSYDVAAHVVDTAERRRIEKLVALVELPEAEISIDGRVEDMDRLAGLDLVATAGGENLAAALAAFGVEGGSAIPFSLDLRISDTGSGWIAEELSFTAGASRLGGYLAMSEGARPEITGQLESPLLDLDALLGTVPDAAADSPFAAADEGRVFPDEPLPFAALQRADLDIGFMVDELRRGEGLYNGVDGAVRLRGGRLVLEDVRARFDEGRVALNGRADANTGQVALDLQGENVDVPAVLGALGIRSSMQGNRGTVALRLEGQGGSPAELAASLSGRADIVLGRGRLRDWTASVLTSDFIRLLSGGSGDGVDVECVVARFDIADGIARTDTVLVQTEGARLAPVGSIDLGRERYDLVLYSRSRMPSLATLAVPLRITGPLDDPSAVPDPALGTVDTIGNLLSLATLGLSRDMFGDKVPAGCAAAGVEGGRDQKGVIEGSTDAVGGAVKDTVKGVGKTIDRIFGD